MKNQACLPALLRIGVLFFPSFYLSAQYTGVGPFCPEDGGLMINEVSNGPTAADSLAEYIEFLVVGDPEDPFAPVDISGWIIDDNNYPETGQGNAPGHLVFGDCYEEMAPGSLVVVYNARSRNASLPPDDPFDNNPSDGVYIIPHHHPCMDACESNPTTASEYYCPCNNLSEEPQGWYFDLTGVGDAIQLRDPCESLAQAFFWEGIYIVDQLGDSPVGFNLGNVAQTGLIVHLTHQQDDNWHNLLNYTNETANGKETPGAPNNAANANFISRLKSGAPACSGKIWDCKDTDAGDLIPPRPLPIQICEGEDLEAFSRAYEQSDEFEPDAPFHFEYAFILTPSEGPQYPILDFAIDGDFDMDSIPAGRYMIWGLSYIQTNGSTGVGAFLSEKVQSVAEIQEYAACGFDADLEPYTAEGVPLTIQISSAPPIFSPASPIALCMDKGQTLSINLRNYDQEINGGQDVAVNWYSNVEKDPIADPLRFAARNTIVYPRTESKVNACESQPLAIPIGVSENPAIEILALNDLFCYDEASGWIALEPRGGIAPYRLDWNLDEYDGQQDLSGLDPGIYHVLVTDSMGCQARMEFTLEEMDSIHFVCESGRKASARLAADGTIRAELFGGRAPYQLRWQGSDSGELFIDSSQNLTITNLLPGNYDLLAVDAEGCERSCSVEVPAVPSVFIPNAFSPDGDELNDVFFVQGGKDVQVINRIMVLNRWGEVVFERREAAANDPSNGWDGAYRGRVLNTGVYIYFIEVLFKEGIKKTYRGDVLLMR